MSRLAIKGHATRGKEVIELLEMMGGKQFESYLGNDISRCYTIINGEIDWDYPSDKYKVFTLEEFLKEFPYKVGNKVIAYAEGCLAQFTIQEIRWNDELNKIEYRICSSWLDANLMWLYKEKKEETMEEKKINQMSLANCDLDEVEIVLGDKFEMEIKDGKYYAVKKKPQYPKTYKECCDVLGLLKPSDDDSNIYGYKTPLLSKFQKLLICRDAWWKMADDWKPDWEEYSIKYCICFRDNSLAKNRSEVVSYVLAFPTEEMRDAFYENFKELINEVKELL